MKINEVNLPHGQLSGYNNPNKIIIHHPEFYGSIESLNSIMRNMGYSMVGYNYYVRKDGSIWKARPDNVQSANCFKQNTCSLGVCFEGNYDKDTIMPKEQFNAGVELIKYLKKKYGINEVNGHKKYYNTECPGRYFPLDKMLDSIKNNIKEEKKVENIVIYNYGPDEGAANYLADYLNCPTISNSRKFDFSCVKNVYAVGGERKNYTGYLKTLITGSNRYDTIQAVLDYIKKNNK